MKLHYAALNSLQVTNMLQCLCWSMEEGDETGLDVGQKQQILLELN